MLRRPSRTLLRWSTIGGLVGLLAGTASPALAAPAKPAKASKSAVSIDLPVQEIKLDNGLRVYVLEDHSTPTFALDIVYDVGSRDEETGRTGFAHLFEHMMFKGSQNVPDGAMFKYIAASGGQLNASTAADYTNYFVVLPSNYLDMAMWLESDRMRSLEISDENFENQRAAVKEERAQNYENVPYAWAFQEFLTKLWKGTGYGHPGIGSQEDLDAAKTADVQAFFDRYYAPNNAVMVVVGDVSVEEVKQKATQYFGNIEKGPAKPPFPATTIDRSKPVEERTEDKLARQPAYLIGWHTVKEDHPDAYALELLGNVLMRGDSSRINKILKDEKKLVTVSQYFPYNQRDVGLFLSLMLPVEGASFDTIKQVVKEEVAKIKKTGITKRELEKAINLKVMDTVGSLNTNLGRAMQIAVGALVYNDPKRVLSDLERFQAVTAKDIKRVANEYLTDNWVVLEIAPGAPKAGLMP